jgi:hypothetical protein
MYGLCGQSINVTGSVKQCNMIADREIVEAFNLHQLWHEVVFS